jgi:hypothetical protein
LSPLLNDVFQSPLLPRDIGDPRWTAGGGLAMPWRMVFATGDYVEGWNGAAGFTLIGLAGAAVAALAMPPLRAVAAIAIIAIVAPIATVNYFRYAFPALVLLTPVMVAATVALASRRTATTLLVAMVVLDLAFQANSFWTLHIGWVRRMVVLPTTESIYERLAPERVIASDLRRDDPEAVVVFAARSAPFAAELAGRAFTTAWYDPELHAASTRAETDPTGNGWRNLFARTGARYVVTTTVARSAALTAALADASRVRQVRAAELWRLPTPGHSKLVVERDLAARMRR